ncbi:MAG: hypothetical protein JNM18_17010 [Planctomycetaceae bacterium]|nr:hypothetical protein [Planctomycetaceae bacterium]
MWRSVKILSLVVIANGLVGLPSAGAQTLDELLLGASSISPQASFAVDSVPAATRTGDELRAAVKASLAQSLVNGQVVTDGAVVHELTSVFRDLKQDDSLAATERAALQRAVTQRLSAISGQLQRRLPQAGQHILGQQFNPFANIGQPAQGNQPQGSDPAQELIDVIQDTIAPTSWEQRGGQGVIRFWGPGHALIIRQSTDVHGALAQLIADLHP